MIIESHIFNLKTLSNTGNYELILEKAEEFYNKGALEEAKIFLNEGLKDTRLLSTYDVEKKEETTLDIGYYFSLLGRIYLAEKNKYRAAECFLRAMEEIIDQYEIADFDRMVEKYQLEKLLQETGYHHKAFTGWFGKEH